MKHWFGCVLYLASVLSAFGQVLPASLGGKVLAFSPASAKVYLGSPSIVILPNGSYVASYDTFGPSSNSDTATLLASSDKGRNWKTLTALHDQYWSSLFVLKGFLYIIGTDRAIGRPVIRRSQDNGATWTTPTTDADGRFPMRGRYITGPVPVLVDHGRVWRTFEVIDGDDLREIVMSAPSGGDILDTRNWTVSTELASNKAWLDGKFLSWEEGNLVETRGGLPAVLLRVNTTVGPEKAAVINFAQDRRTLSFNPASGFIDFPGGGKKFTVRFDPQTQRYWSITNAVSNDDGRTNLERVRNTLALIWSSDLRTWKVQRILLRHPDRSHHGFQYADWQFDGKDIVSVIRMAYDDDHGGAESQHNSNYIMFLRIPNFAEP